MRKKTAVAIVAASALVLGSLANQAAASSASELARTVIVAGNPATQNVALGPDTLDEPFNCWTDGAFGVVNIAGTDYSLSPVNDGPCQHYVWSGSDVQHLTPKTLMNGLTYNVHTDRGRVYDGGGWWPLNLWVDTSTVPNTWYSYMHTEDGSQCDTGLAGYGSDLRTVGTWHSTDAGANWTYDGVALSLDSTRPFNAPNNNCFSQTGWPKMGGTGDQELIYGQDGYLYLLYTQFTWDDPTGVPADRAHDKANLAIARSSLTDKGAPGTWYKYYNGQWLQPGQGGHETYVMSGYDQNGVENQQRAVTWSSYLNSYVMVFASNDGIDISYSTDLLNWTKPQFLYVEGATNSTYGFGSNFLAYVNLVGTGQGASGTTQSVGQTAWFYYVVGNKSYEIHRRLLTFNKDTNLAYGRPTLASDAFGFGDPVNATDGSLSSYVRLDTRTAANVNYGTLGLDLGAATTFNTVRLQPDTRLGYGFPTDFEIDGASSSSGPWTAIKTYTGYPQPNSGETQTFSLGAQSYRYVRVAWSKVSNNGESVLPFSFRLADFEVYNKASADPVPAAPTSTTQTRQASTDFSGTQGSNAWQYMYRSPLDPGNTYAQWVPLAYTSGTSTYGLSGSDATISSSVEHPGASAASVARVWRAAADGTVHITGTVKKQDVSGGDGVQVRVMVNRASVWPSSGGWQNIAFNDATGYSVDTYQQVHAGDRVLFVVDGGATSTHDATTWDPRIDYVPVTTSSSSYAGFSSTQGTNNWSYQYWTGSSYVNLTWDSGTSTWIRSATATVVGKDWQHPDASSDSVRVWTAPSAGFVSVTGQVKKGDTTGGDGVLAQIRVNGSVVWPSGGGWQTIAATDAVGTPTNVSFGVASGDKVQFVVNRNANSSYDTTVWPVSLTLG